MRASTVIIEKAIAVRELPQHTSQIFCSTPLYWLVFDPARLTTTYIDSPFERAPRCFLTHRRDELIPKSRGASSFGSVHINDRTLSGLPSNEGKVWARLSFGAVLIDRLKEAAGAGDAVVLWDLNGYELVAQRLGVVDARL
jgi:hypothetical protein